MKKGGGRAKGNGYENKTAKKVVAAFAAFGIRRKDCYRTPLSGGHKFASQKDPGDLIISKRLEKMFPFSVECKFYKKVKLWALWTPIEDQKKAWKFRIWLRQARKAAGKKIPLLVFKENNGPDMCAFPTENGGHIKPGGKMVPRLYVPWKSTLYTVARLDDLLIELVAMENKRRKENVR